LTTQRSDAYSVVPKLAELRDSMLFGDIWERPQLSKRDRSMITVAVLTAMYRGEELRGHIARALDNGLSREEISEVITHVTFYAGWPTGVNAARMAKDVFESRP
jgi:4-carboxymuconolactone decarboxylase